MIDASLILQAVTTVGVAYIVKVAVTLEHRLTVLETNVKQIMFYCPNCPNPPERTKK